MKQIKGVIMFRKFLIVVGLLAATMLAGTTNSDSFARQRELPQPKEEYPQTVEAINKTVSSLSHHVDLWHDAILKGDEKAARHWEDELVKIVNGDLEDSKRTVRHYARKSSLAGAVEMNTTKEENVNRDQDVSTAFRTALSILNTKEQLALSFSRTSAFSNKYRLISDYIEVLRKQLGMQKLKLADEGPANNTTVPQEKQEQ